MAIPSYITIDWNGLLCEELLTEGSTYIRKRCNKPATVLIWHNMKKNITCLCPECATQHVKIYGGVELLRKEE